MGKSVVAVGAAVVLLVIWGTGCGGGGGTTVCTGAVEGCVFVPEGGGEPILVCCPPYEPPEGYVPAVGAVVRVIGVEGAETVTDENGHYFISDVPPGARTIEIIVEGQPPLRISVPVASKRTTCGSGHVEGGGGLF